MNIKRTILVLSMSINLVLSAESIVDDMSIAKSVSQTKLITGHTIGGYISFLERYSGEFSIDIRQLDDYDLLIYENGEFIIEVPFVVDTVAHSVYDTVRMCKGIPPHSKLGLLDKAFVVVSKYDMKNIDIVELNRWYHNPSILIRKLNKRKLDTKRSNFINAFDYGKFNEPLSSRIFDTLKTQVVIPEAKELKSLNDILERMRKMYIGHIIYNIEMIDYGVYSMRIMISDYAREKPIDFYIYVPFTCSNINYDRFDFILDVNSKDIFVDIYVGGQVDYEVFSTDILGLEKFILKEYNINK